SKDNRRAILAFEATEGGAGVLGRLLSESKAIAHVARAALSLMHFDNIDIAIGSGESEALVDKPEANCVKGCYRCLLSYYNQPDHELIDRRDADALRILLRLARSEVGPIAISGGSGGNWGEAIRRWRMPTPDGRPLQANGEELPLVWRSRRIVGVSGPV